MNRQPQPDEIWCFKNAHQKLSAEAPSFSYGEEAQKF